MEKHFKNSKDLELLELLGQGGLVASGAFDEIYQRYTPKLYTYCLKVTGNYELANDIFQETLIKFIDSAKNGLHIDYILNYMIKIARNLCLNERKRNREKFVSLDDINVPSYDKSYETKQLNDILETIVADLPVELREVLVMKEYMNLSYTEIAEALEISMSSVKTRIYRAKNKIKEIMSPYLNDLK